MRIDWATLGEIAVVAAAAALITVLLVALALVATSGNGNGKGNGNGNAARTHAGGTAVAGLCLLSAGLIVSYGLYLIIA